MSLDIRQIDSNTWALFADESDVGTLTSAQINSQSFSSYLEGLKFTMSNNFRNKIKEIGDAVVPVGGSMIVTNAPGANQNVGTYGFQFIGGGGDRTDDYTNHGCLLINKYDAGVYTSPGVTRKFVFLFNRIQWDFRNIPFSPNNG